MKYLFFTLTVMCTVPALVFLLNDRKLIRWSVCALVLPLSIFNQTAINFFSEEKYRGSARGMEVSLVYIAALTLLMVFTVLHGKRKLLPEAGTRIYLIYFLFCLPSLANAPNTLFSFFELWKMIMVYLVFLAVYYYLEFTDGDLDTLLYSVAMLVAINTVTVLAQKYVLGKHQPRGVFPHQNSMAMYMSVAGLLFLSRFINVQDRRGSRIFFIAFLLASFCVVYSLSRGAIFCYAIGGIVTLLCSTRGGLSFRKLRKLSLIVLLAAIGMSFAARRIVERFERAPEASAQTRRNLAVAAVNMMKDKTFFGIGINNWGICINPPYNYSRHRDWNKGWTDEHQDGIVETIYLLVAAECGIPCLIMLLVWFGYYWFSCIFLLKKLRMTNYFFLPAGALGALTSVYLQSTLEWVLKQQMNLIWLMTIFGCISFLNRHHEQLVAPLLAYEHQHQPVPPEAPEPATAGTGTPVSPSCISVDQSGDLLLTENTRRTR